jgi:hypothetical protein
MPLFLYQFHVMNGGRGPTNVSVDPSPSKCSPKPTVATTHWSIHLKYYFEVSNFKVLVFSSETRHSKIVQLQSSFAAHNSGTKTFIIANSLVCSTRQWHKVVCICKHPQRGRICTVKPQMKHISKIELQRTQIPSKVTATI